MINLAKLAEQQKNQRAVKYKNTLLKKTLDKSLADTFAPVTKKIIHLSESTMK